jgi:hypothetical protein
MSNSRSNNRRSTEVFFQWAFAISPFPSYLPQYFSILQQLSSSSSSITNENIGSGVGGGTNNDFMYHSNDNIVESAEKALQLRKRRGQQQQQQQQSFISSSSSVDGMDLLLGTTTSTSKSFEGCSNNNTNISENNNISTIDTGLSRATVLLLLSAHLLRLLHFHGVILLIEERDGDELSRGLEFDPLLLAAVSEASDTAASSLLGPSSSTTMDVSTTTLIAALPSSSQGGGGETETLSLQWDLLGQSISMIIMQLMLLHTMMLLRRRHTTTTTTTAKGGMNAPTKQHHSSHDSLTTPSPNSRSNPLLSNSSLSSLRMDLGYSPTDNNNNSSSSSSPKMNQNSTALLISSWIQRHIQRCYRATSTHLLHLYSPHAILQTHSFFEYLEVLLLSSLSVKLIFDYHWFPQYGSHVVELLKQMSIILESCLALPQAIRNYRNGSTRGLSAVMVVGWVAGDFFKLCYFLLQIFGNAKKNSGSGSSSGSNNNVVFVWGCLFSLLLDSIVGVQIARHQPEAVECWKRSMRNLKQHWKKTKNKDKDDANEQRQESRKGGVGMLVTTCISTILHWVCKIRPWIKIVLLLSMIIMVLITLRMVFI